jgi:beta-lactam-binding protein with PASTA domain
MPRVVGRRGFNAELTLEALGLVVNTVRVETENPAKVGYVISQDPRQKTVVTEGTRVTIAVGVEPKGNGGGNGGGGGDGGGGG